MIKIEDNFLPDETFKKIQDEIMGPDFPWFYNKGVAGRGYTKDVLLTHMFYDNNFSLKDSNMDQNISNWFRILQPILDNIRYSSLIRIKANSYPWTPTLVEHKYHVDYEFPCMSGLFYLNTNDGYTKFEKDNLKVESIANRFVSFPTHLSHASSSCTNDKVRYNINFNYFGV